MPDYIPCINCGKMGYSDERIHNGIGHLCVRCANPHIDFTDFVIKEA